MKTRKHIEAELKLYDILDNPEEIKRRGLYQGPQPISEYVHQRDQGFREALKWVLEKDNI